MIKRYLISVFAVFAFCAQNVYAQQALPSVSADALAYGKYADIPVNGFTGTADVTIPLHTITDGPLSLPIYLQYHTVGQTVASPASSVGLGWNLNAGGMITRVVQGLPDDYSLNGYYHRGAEIQLPTSQTSSVWGWDTEPDIFTYSFGGYVGKFFIDPNQQVRTVPKTDLKIELIEPYHDQNNHAFQQINITTPDGVIYKFGQTSNSLYVGYDYVAHRTTINPAKDRTAWHLVEVVSPDQKHRINIEYYGDVGYTFTTPNVCPEEVKYRKYSGSIGTENECAGGGLGVYNARTVLPKKIVTSTTVEVIEFSRASRDDVSPYFAGNYYYPFRINGMSIQNGAVCVKWDFQQSFFKSSGSTSAAKRLKLDAVQKKSCDNSISENAWRLIYSGTVNTDGTQFFPAPTDKNIDHWGYFNKVVSGPDNNSFSNITPRTSIVVGGSPTQYGDANRATAEAPMLEGMLDRVVYPTGGYLDLDYEANRYRTASTVLTPVDIEPCSENCLGEMDQSEPFTLTQAMLNGNAWWSLEVSQTPGVPYSQFYGRIEVTTTSGVKVTELEWNANFTRPGVLPVIGPIPPNDSLRVGRTYNIRVISYNAAVRFTIQYNTAQTDQLCGGLRLKQTRVHDGIQSSNDIIQTYSYKQKSANTSSGILFKIPKYGYSLNSRSALFTAYSITPLTTFAGYHIGYGRVVVDRNGLGQEETIYEIESQQSYNPSNFPAIPDNFKVLDGVAKETNIYAQGSNQLVAQSKLTRHPSDNYMVFGGSTPGRIFAARSLRVYVDGSVKNYNFSTNYTVRTGIYRISKVATVTDGITSETSHIYGSTLLVPTETTITNSNGDIHKTVTAYSGEHYDNTFRPNFIKHNILYHPYLVDKYYNGVKTSLRSSTYRYFRASGSDPSASSTNRLDVPRVYETKEIEKYYNNQGQLTGNEQYVTVSTVEEYNEYGFPRYVRRPGWARTEYRYTADKLLYEEVFNNRIVKTYTFNSIGGSLPTALTVDGSTVSYRYDKLGRLQSITDSCQNIVTTYSYHFSTGSADKNYTEIKVDYPKPSLNSALDIVETRTYLDGLGRAIQTVAKKQGPSNTQDVIVAQEYDKHGRVFRTYEPFAFTSNNGAYRTPSTSWGYSQTTYETSPLSRVLTVTPPSWTATTYTYGSNSDLDAVKKLPASGNYTAGSLSKLTVTDGNGNKLITFSDKLGRRILSRRTTAADATADRLDTYYLYNGKGLLDKVLPPGASLSTTNLIYTYLYDGKDQLIEKTVPGGQKEEFKYNSRQLLAATRDGKLRAAGKWYAHNYDTYGRETKAGLFTGASAPGNLDNITLSELLIETGYGSQVHDWNEVTLSKIKVLGSASDFITTNNVYTTCGVLDRQTGNNHLLLSPSNGELTTYTYDGAANVVGSTYTHKAPGQTHTIASASFIDHAGRITSNDFKLNAGTNRKLHQIVYDQKGNVVTKYQGGTGLSGSLAYLQKIDYSYLPNGLLQGINMNTATGKLSGAQVALPAVGATASTPSPGQLLSTNSYDERDLFYVELYRNAQATGVSTSSFPTRRNGDIVAVASQVRGRRQQLWTVNYDAYDRMRGAAFYQRETRTSTPTLYANYDEDIDGYDARGNIQGLDRDDAYTSGGKWYTEWIDDLDFTYEPGSNRLRDIEEDMGTARGYGRSTSLFDYDENGNVKYDPGRGLTITYNYLNVPTRFSWTDGRKMDMVYDATGTLLTRTTTAANGTVVEERHYVGGLEYLVSGPPSAKVYTLESVHHAEGRILLSGTTQEWQYTLTDHLGNTRLVYVDRDGDGLVQTPTEIIQEEHYFPFGMKMTGPWMGGAAGAKTKYQYNGIEHLDAFALNVNQAHYRTLDPTTGRWWGVDPFANSFKSLSPYCAMGNSPVVYTDPGGGFITWSVNNGGISIGFNLTPIGIPLGAGINVGWSNGGSVGAYGEVGYRVGGTGLGAGATVMVGVDYSIANNTTSGSVGFQAYGSFGPGFAGGSISTNGWSVNAGIGVGNAKSGVGFGVGYGSDGFTYGISGYSGGSGSKKRADSGPDDDIARRSNRGPNAGKDPAWDPQPAEVSKVQPDGGLDLEQAARTGLYDGPLSDPNAFGSGQSSVRNGYLAGRNHPITGVPFDLNGFPNFKDHLHPSLPNNVYITPTGNRAKDFAAANAQANIPFTPKHYVWHHHQEYGRMQLVRQSVHQKTGHTGGFHLWRKN